MNDRLWIYLLFPGIPFLFLYFIGRRINRRRRESRLPLHEIRRPPGFGLQEMADEQWDRVLFGITSVMFAAIAPALIYVAGGSLLPSICFGVVLCPITIWQLWKDWGPLPNYRLGVMGEQATGGVLDSIQREDTRVFHDLVVSEHGRTRNIDHIVLTASGLYCVETKARRKMHQVPGDDWVITFDGECVHFPNGSWDTKAIEQTLWNAQWLARRANQLTGGDSVPVFPVLVYPGWMIKRTGKGAVQVVSHKELRQLVPRGGPEISGRNLRILNHWLEQECLVKIPPTARLPQSSPNQGISTPVSRPAEVLLR